MNFVTDANIIMKYVHDYLPFELQVNMWRTAHSVLFKNVLLETDNFHYIKLLCKCNERPGLLSFYHTEPASLTEAIDNYKKIIPHLLKTHSTRISYYSTNITINEALHLARIIHILRKKPFHTGMTDKFLLYYFSVTDLLNNFCWWKFHNEAFSKDWLLSIQF